MKFKINALIAGIFVCGALCVWFLLSSLEADSQSEVSSGAETNQPFCDIAEDEKATSGIFCSDKLGFKLAVPENIQGRLVAGASEKRSVESNDGVVSAIQSFTTGESYAKNPEINYSIEVSEYSVQTAFYVSSGAVYSPITKQVTDKGVEAQSTTVDGVKVYGIGRRDDANINGSLIFMRNDRLFLMQYRIHSIFDAEDSGIQKFNQDLVPLLTFYGANPETAVSQSNLTFN